MVLRMMLEMMMMIPTLPVAAKKPLYTQRPSLTYGLATSDHRTVKLEARLLMPIAVCETYDDNLLTSAEKHLV